MAKQSELYAAAYSINEKDLDNDFQTCGLKELLFRSYQTD